MLLSGNLHILIFNHWCEAAPLDSGVKKKIEKDLSVGMEWLTFLNDELTFASGSVSFFFFYEDR